MSLITRSTGRNNEFLERARSKGQPPRIRLILAAILQMAVSSSALAAYGQTWITYDGVGLSGYSQTQPTSEFGVSDSDCYPESGEYICVFWSYSGTVVDLDVYAPVGVYYSGTDYSTWNAWLDIPYLEDPISGLWSAYGDHYVEWDVLIMQCSFQTTAPWQCNWTIDQYYEYQYVDSTYSSVYINGPPSCTGEPALMANEYSPGAVYPNGVTPGVACFSFDYYSPGYQILTNFTWSELNGGFLNGNPHTGWGYVSSSVQANLQAIRNAYGMAIKVTSGYRCPHGNISIAGASATSHHMRGRAVDMYKLGGQVNPYWSQQEFDELYNVALNYSPTEIFDYSKYSDHHLHVAW